MTDETRDRAERDRKSTVRSRVRLFVTALTCVSAVALLMISIVGLAYYNESQHAISRADRARLDARLTAVDARLTAIDEVVVRNSVVIDHLDRRFEAIERVRPPAPAAGDAPR